jgi:hypothetical protein
MALASSGLRLGARRLFLELGATGTHQLRILGQVLILVDTRAYLKKRHCFTPPLKALSRLTYAGDNPKRRENSGLKASVVSTPDPITQSGPGARNRQTGRAGGAERSGYDDQPDSGELFLSPEIDHFVMAITAGEAMAPHTHFCEVDHIACRCQDYASALLVTGFLAAGRGRHGKRA